MDGPTATLSLRKLGCTVPIFGCTGNTHDADVDRFIQAGATDVFGKPFDIERFHECMKLLSGECMDV